MKIISGLLLTLCTLLSPSVQAKTLVLIHGFQAQGMDWRTNKVGYALQRSGWVDAGHLRTNLQGRVTNTLRLPRHSTHTFYTLDLPTFDSITQQARWLNQYLDHIYKKRGEPLELVAHSAGGVVARYWLVKYNAIPINSLITIATPHLGTPWSDIAKQLANTPLARMSNIMGIKYLRRSLTLLEELKEDRPGTFMYWLNHQPHPSLRYVSIVRNNEQPNHFDFIVPFASQNMNNTLVLHQRSEVWLSDGNHFLNMRDGYRLHHVINYDH